MICSPVLNYKQKERKRCQFLNVQFVQPKKTNSNLPTDYSTIPVNYHNICYDSKLKKEQKLTLLKRLPVPHLISGGDSQFDIGCLPKEESTLYAGPVHSTTWYPLKYGWVHCFSDFIGWSLWNISKQG
jgi:hypothetical protein